MKHIVKILSIIAAISSIWISLLQASIVPRSHTWLLPIYLIVSLGCYGLLMVGVGLMNFPTCPQEASLLQKDITEAKAFLTKNGVDVGLNDEVNIENLRLVKHLTGFHLEYHNYFFSSQG